MGIYQQKWWFNGNLPAKMVIQCEFTSKYGDLMWIYLQRLWLNGNLPAKWWFNVLNGNLPTRMVIQWEFTSKNGDSMGIYQQKWWFNGNLPAKMVIQWVWPSGDGSLSWLKGSPNLTTTWVTSWRRVCPVGTTASTSFDGFWVTIPDSQLSDRNGQDADRLT